MRARLVSITTLVVVGLVTGGAAAPVAAARAAGTQPSAVEAEVERTSTGFTISWAPSARVKAVRWGDDPDRVDEVLVASVPKGEHEVTVDDPSPGARP